MNTAKQVGQSARDLTQKIARQMAQEPFEVVKTAEEQVISPEVITPNENSNNENQQKTLVNQQKLQDKMMASRRMEALNRELKDIHKQDLFKDLQNKIAQGVEVPLEDYSELSLEQKQVLKAQMEAVKNQKRQMAYNESQKGFPLVSSKPSRRFGADRSRKAEAERQQTRVEKPVPPSG